MSDRLQCCVPFCNHTHANKEGFTAWVCPQHWKLVPRKARWAYSMAKRRHKPVHVINMIWDRCAQYAKDAAMGI